MRLLSAIFISLLVSSCAFGPLGVSKKAIKQLDKGNVLKTQELVKKALEKDSLLPAALYAKSRLLVSYDSQEFYDSAHLYILKAQAVYDTIDVKIKDKHQKNEFDNARFQDLKLKIDSLAFKWATHVNTEDGYNDFLTKYTDAKQRSLAKTKRNLLAFATAKKENTYQSYKQFMEKYPDAVQVAEAKRRYEKLYFDKSTADGRVMSYIRFLEKHPSTPYRKEAEQKIFEVMTSEHSVGGYQLFIRKYPKSHLRKKSINYAYHVSKETGQRFPKELLSDSLKRAQSLEQYELITILEEGLFGFADTEGKTILSPKYKEVDNQYLCRSTKEDFLLVNDQVEGRNGTVISATRFEEVVDMGYGLLKVKLNDKWGVLHKSGDKIVKLVYDEVKLLNGNILALRMATDWNLQTISGRLLVRDQFDDLYQQGEFFFFEKDDLVVVKNVKSLLSAVDNNPVPFEYLFGDYELLPDGNIWLQSNYGETVMNSELEELIPYADQKIEPLNNGFLIENMDKYEVLDNEYKTILTGIENGKYNNSWFTGWSDTTALAISMADFQPKEIKADSTGLLGESFLLAFNTDTVDVYFGNDTIRSFLRKNSFELIGNTESGEYLLVAEDDSKRLFNIKGEFVLEIEAEQLTPLGTEYLVFTENRKKGLYSLKTGKRLLKPTYDAIGNYKNGSVSLLKDQRFGLFNANKGLSVDTKYERNIIDYNDSVFIASEKGKLYLLGKDGKHLNKEGFDKIDFWNDTLSIVKHEGSWRLFDFSNGLVEGLSFQSYTTYEYADNEKLAIILSENKYGVVNESGVVVIPPTFNDIVLISTSGAPVIFTEKHIKEVEFYVVIYYDIAGNILKKQAFESKAYYRIYCEQ